MAYPYEIVLRAFAYLLTEVRKMRLALAELGHTEAYERQPSGLEEQLAKVEQGASNLIGTQADPFVLHGQDDRPVASYYIEADDAGARIHMVGSAEFMDAYETVAQRDGGPWRH